MDAAMNNQEILAMIRQEIAANNAAQAQARSFSQGTTNFGLPQWEPNDKPTFLVDMNGAYRTIDTQMQANKNDANSAITAAESANTLSNQALTASRENAQNIVTLTNNLTNTNNKLFEHADLYIPTKTTKLYEKIFGYPQFYFFSNKPKTGTIVSNLDITIQNVELGQSSSGIVNLVTFEYDYPEINLTTSSSNQFRTFAHWYSQVEAGYTKDTVFSTYLRVETTPKSITFALPPNFVFHGTSVRFEIL